MQAGSITATPRVDQMQDHRQRQEDAGAVETAEVHPCSLETILARTGTKAPRSPGLWHQETSWGLGQRTGDPEWATALVPQGASCRVTGVQHGDLGAKGEGGTETSLLNPHGDLTPSPESSLCSGPWLGSRRKDLEAQTVELNKVGGTRQGTEGLPDTPKQQKIRH